ncbi:hypothetical protein GQS40_06960|uniref:Uncharacterized protein n=1 Tax=Leuconostoc lactis TaxID=1246 RepID=A0A6L7ABB8_LEULA|nr:hypothetical protein [Leuconostoc lactis]
MAFYVHQFFYHLGFWFSWLLIPIVVEIIPAIHGRSGIIETAAFWGLIAFYPVYTIKRRIILAIAGAVCLFAANVIRLSVVAITVYFFGDSSFYLAHAIIIVGSAGLFVLLLLWSKPYGVWLFSTIVTGAVGLVGSLTGLFETFGMAHVIQVISHQQTHIMVVDYEIGW